jgi:hypothetical protein
LFLEDVLLIRLTDTGCSASVILHPILRCRESEMTNTDALEKFRGGKGNDKKQ